MLETLIFSINRIIALIKKEFLAMILDKNTRKILVLPIIIQSLLFGYGATFNFDKVPYVLLNESSDTLALNLINDINGGKFFKLQKQCFNYPCFKEAIDNKEGLLGLYIKDNFKSTHELMLICDARNTASANTALSYMSDLIEQYFAKNGIKSPLNIEYRFLFNEQNYTRYTLLTGMILGLSLIQVLMLSSFCISREREDGTYDMMLMTPLNVFEILIGKAIVPVGVAIFQGLLLFIICRYYFAIPFRGSLFVLFIILFIFALCFVGLGLAISSFCNTSQQSLVCSFSLVLPFIILSGMITPVEAMPSYFQICAKLNPVYYGVMALLRVYLQGQNLFDVLHLLMPLMLLALITMSFSLYLFRHRLE